MRKQTANREIVAPGEGNGKSKTAYSGARTNTAGNGGRYEGKTKNRKRPTETRVGRYKGCGAS